MAYTGAGAGAFEVARGELMGYLRDDRHGEGEAKWERVRDAWSGLDDGDRHVLRMMTATMAGGCRASPAKAHRVATLP